MFIQILIIFFILILVYFIIKYLLIRTHKLFLDPSKVKYTLLDSDYDYLKKYSDEIPIFELKGLSESVFYTNKKWSSKNNNYIKFKKRYYIIEPGYYYYILPETELFLNNNCNIYLKKK